MPLAKKTKTGGLSDEGTSMRQFNYGEPDQPVTRQIPPVTSVKVVGPSDPTITSRPIARYRVLWNQSDKPLIILQFPNRDRDQPYNAANKQKPLGIRIKPKCGIVEIDIPMDIHRNFDREKGIEYGEAIRKSKLLQQGGSYGMPGGLGIGGPSRSTRDNEQAPSSEISQEILLEDFDDSNNKGYVMNKITLGGRITRPLNGKPIMAVGVFRGNELHLTRVSGMVSLQPIFHHLDALTDNEKSSLRAQHDADDVPQESEARAVNMTVKSTDEEELDMSDIAKELREMQEEPWQHLDWIDEDNEKAYRAYNDKLFLQPQYKDRQLLAAMTKEQYMDAISAPRLDPTRKGKKIMTSEQPSESDSSEGEVDEEGINDEVDEEGDDEGAEKGDTEAGDGEKTV